MSSSSEYNSASVLALREGERDGVCESEDARVVLMGD
jgi:hypothetical protein